MDLCMLSIFANTSESTNQSASELLVMMRASTTTYNNRLYQHHSYIAAWQLKGADRDLHKPVGTVGDEEELLPSSFESVEQLWQPRPPVCVAL